VVATAVDTPSAPTPLQSAVRTEHLTKVYGKGEATVHALDRVSLKSAGSAALMSWRHT